MPVGHPARPDFGHGGVTPNAVEEYVSRAIRALVALVTMTLMLAACSPGGNGPEKQTRTLTVGASAEPPTMDPTANDAAAIPQVLLYNVYETLVKLDSNGELKPLLAQRWEVSPDNLTYTFQLDPAAKFATGRKVTADDVAASIKKIKFGEVSPTLAKQMAVVADVVPTDEDTVTVTLNKPSNEWLYNMSSTAGMIFDTTGDVDLAKATAGSGPYQLAEWNPGQNVVLSRTADYWGTDARFDEVVFRYFTDPNAMNAAMLSGELDIISNLQAPAALSQFQDPEQFKVVEGTTNGEVVLSMNNTAPTLSDKRVRQAIRYAVDKKALLDTVWNGHGTLIGSMVPPTDPWYEDLTGDYPHDPEKAKQLIAEAGAQGATLRLRLPTLAYARGAGQFVASQLKDVGLNVVIDELEFPARWIDTVLTKGDYDLSIVSHVEARDLSRFANPNYYFHYNNPEFTKLIEDGDAADHDTYVADRRKAAKLLSDDAAADWLFLLPNLVITKPNISGVPQNATTLSFDLTTIAAG